MKSSHTSTRDLAWALRQQAKRTGEQAPSVRGSDWRLATVTAINTDGTVDADGIAGIRRMEFYTNPAVGDVIRIDQSSSGNLVAMGRLATTEGTAWTPYTVAWTSTGTAPSIGNGTLIGRYVKHGRTVVCHINWTSGSTTSYGTGNYAFSLPVQAAAAGAAFIGNAHYLQADRWTGQTVISSGATTTAPFFPVSTTDTRADWMTPADPETHTSGAQLRMTLVYESAT